VHAYVHAYVHGCLCTVFVLVGRWVHVRVCGLGACVCACVYIPTFYYSFSFPSQIMSSNEEYMDLLLSLGEFALMHNNVLLREVTRNLLKLIPSGNF